MMQGEISKMVSKYMEERLDFNGVRENAKNIVKQYKGVDETGCDEVFDQDCVRVYIGNFYVEPFARLRKDGGTAAIEEFLTEAEKHIPKDMKFEFYGDAVYLVVNMRYGGISTEDC